MNQIWQYWKSGVNAETVEKIIEIGNAQPEVEAGLGFDGSTTNLAYRSSQIRWIPPLQNPEVRDLIWYFARIANRNAFGFNVDYLNDIQYTTYHSHENGKYDWHCDTFWGNPTPYDRKISVVIQLSDPSEYEGGDFEVDNHHPQLPKEEIRAKGTVIVFPSFLHHRVTPVTSGVRRSLVSWIEGPKFR